MFRVYILVKKRSDVEMLVLFGAEMYREWMVGSNIRPSLRERKLKLRGDRATPLRRVP